MTEAVTEPALAKINPLLRVLGRRDDGYHDIETLILPNTLADGIQVVPAEDLQLRVVGDLASEVPPGDDNLVLVAARALKEKVGEKRGAGILLSKGIPVAAGLGGGSADAAATLRALNRLWDTGLGLEELVDAAAEIGSDVPALVHSGPVIARGRGELVEPIALPKSWWVLKPLAIAIASEDAYAYWDQDGVTDPEPSALLDAMRARDLELAGTLLMNDLEAPVRSRVPEVAEARRLMLAAGALGAVMSGSGPTVAGLARDAAHAEELAGETGGIAVASMSAR